MEKAFGFLFRLTPLFISRFVIERKLCFLFLCG